jgi:hypothetical protein
MRKAWKKGVMLLILGLLLITVGIAEGFNHDGNTSEGHWISTNMTSSEIIPGIYSLPADATAELRIREDIEVNVGSNIIAPGTLLGRYWGSLLLKNTQDSSHTTLGNISKTMEGDSFTQPEFPLNATWNSTYIHWVFPAGFVLIENDTLQSNYHTSAFTTVINPVNLTRYVNQSIFSTEGFQFNSYEVTLDENTDYSYDCRIAYEQKAYSNSSILFDTFTTDLPLKSQKNGSYLHPITGQYISEINFTINNSSVELHHPYHFNFTAAIKPTNNEGLPVKMYPRIFFALYKNLASQQGDVAGLTAIMPSSLLPVHVTYTSATTNVSNIWLYSSDFKVKLAFNNVAKKIMNEHSGIFRQSNGNWYFDTTRTGVVSKTFRFGKNGDIALRGDWDGNGVFDVGVFRPSSGNWYLDTTKTGVVNKTFHFGTTGDVPVTGDWDGTGITNAGIFRPSKGNWYLDTNKTGVVNTTFHFGKNGDIPVVGDWNSDGISDIGIFRPSNGNWYLDTTKSGEVNVMLHFGKNGDIPVVGDWNDDSISDIGVFRPSDGNWYLCTTKTGTLDMMFHFGKNGDVPVVGDWDGNDIADVGVFRPSNGNWYLDTTKTGVVNQTFHFGTSGDSPIVGSWI